MSDSSGLNGARRHPIHFDRPAPDFFEGALLGNGGLGAVVCSRPDAVMIHFGHNAIWDIRTAEENTDHIGTFSEIFPKVEKYLAESEPCARPDEQGWLGDYQRRMALNYNRPYPRPYPCGTFVLGFDRRNVETIGHTLHIAEGCCDIRFLVKDQLRILRVFFHSTLDDCWMQTIDEDGTACSSWFNRVAILPENAPKDLPMTEEFRLDKECTLAFRQVLPYLAPPSNDLNAILQHANDRAFTLVARLSAPFHEDCWTDFTGCEQNGGVLYAGLDTDAPLCGVICVRHGLKKEISVTPPSIPDEQQLYFVFQETSRIWADYWSASGVELADTELEQVWYRNLYFLRCCLRAGEVCPGLFGNWSLGLIGTAWHGDYHMNYNTQQPFWAAFSSNHPELHEPYVDMVHHLLPLSRSYARNYYQMPGAFFPHSAYPTEMTVPPFPLPVMAWEVCETPWTVQSLWWHYRYTLDENYLRDRAYEPIREAVRFLVAYISRPDARGGRFKDDRWHIYPTIVPEVYLLRNDLDRNYDCIADLTLARFIMRAFQEACQILNMEDEEQALLESVQAVLDHMPDLPTKVIKDYGEIFLSHPTEGDLQTVFNCPIPLMPVFPGEEVGIHSTPRLREISETTYRFHKNEGGNELVFLNLQAARLGILDLQRWKRQIRYCMMPGGYCTDRVLQVRGRYDDRTSFDFMSRMGIWIENFALPAVINECLLQSYNGIIRLFPNWPSECDASFHNLRAAGAVLVSASLRSNSVECVVLHSEKGGMIRLVSPWPESQSILCDGTPYPAANSILEFNLSAGMEISLTANSL